VLSSRDHLTCDLGMSRRDGQVDHNFHAWVVEDSGNVADGRNVVLRRLLLRSLEDDVADGQHLSVGEAGEVLQIGVADGAGADHPDAHRPTHN
jgi:hypothetical protein